MKWADPTEDQRNMLYQQLYNDPKAIEAIRRSLMDHFEANPPIMVTQPRTIMVTKPFTDSPHITAQQAGKWLSSYTSSNLLPPRPRVERRMPTEEEAGHYIRAAAQAIEQYGWIQHTLGNVFVGFCVIGAVSHVVSTVYTNNVLDLFVCWLTAQGVRIEAIAAWNDAPGQDKDTILLYMHKYADEVAPLPAPLLEESDAI